MFGLIISIISIVIVVALVAATMYFGGDVSTQGKEEAEVAKALNELGQIKAAVTAFTAKEGRAPTGLAELTPKYLGSIPDGWGGDVPSQVAFESSQLLTGNEPDKLTKCNAINQRLGYTFTEPPTCASISANFSGCCVAP